MERDALEQRSLGARIGDAIAIRAGQMWFIVVHAVFFTGWIWINLKRDPPFDPYPFPLLSLVVALEAIFLSLFILMSQNRCNLQAEQRNHLDLQINLLAEQENTEMLILLRKICHKLDLEMDDGSPVESLANVTDPHALIQQIQETQFAGRPGKVQ